MQISRAAATIEFERIWTLREQLALVRANINFYERREHYAKSPVVAARHAARIESFKKDEADLKEAIKAASAEACSLANLYSDNL